MHRLSLLPKSPSPMYITSEITHHPCTIFAINQFLCTPLSLSVSYCLSLSLPWKYLRIFRLPCCFLSVLLFQDGKPSQLPGTPKTPAERTPISNSGDRWWLLQTHLAEERGTNALLEFVCVSEIRGSGQCNLESSPLTYHCISCVCVCDFVCVYGCENYIGLICVIWVRTYWNRSIITKQEASLFILFWFETCDNATFCIRAYRSNFINTPTHTSMYLCVCRSLVYFLWSIYLLSICKFLSLRLARPLVHSLSLT